MKTIAATALFIALSVPALAADDKTVQTTEAKKPRTPIVLSVKQLDGVTAGQQINQITAFLDGSNVYGDTDEPGVGGVTIYLDLNRNSQ